MKSILIEAESVSGQLVEAGIPEAEVMPIQSKGLGGEVVASAALVSLAAGTITAITKVIVELIRKQKSFSVKIDGGVVDFSATNMSEDEVASVLSKFMDN